MKCTDEKIRSLMSGFIMDFKLDCYAACCYECSVYDFGMMVWSIVDSLCNSKDKAENAMAEKYMPLVRYLDVNNHSDEQEYKLPDCSDYYCDIITASGLIDMVREELENWRPGYDDAVAWMKSRKQEHLNLLKWNFDMSRPKSDHDTPYDRLRGYYEILAEMILWILIDKIMEEGKDAEV